MLDDRSYMRSPEYNPSRFISMTNLLLGLNLLVFVLLEINKAYFRVSLHYFALSNQGLAHGYLWQLVTFQFMHLNGMHLFWNLLGIYLFGRSVEQALGPKHFLALYFSSGVLGGLVQAFLGLLTPAVFGVPVVGASAGVFALLAAFSVLNPHATILLFFIIPVRAKYFLWIGGGIALFYILVPASPGVAHGAHLGGLLGGVAYIHWVIRGHLLDSFHWPSFRPPARRARVLVSASNKCSFWERPKPVEPEDLPPAEFISREVDPILDKISAHGIHSLTERERKILEAARAKMAKR